MIQPDETCLEAARRDPEAFGELVRRYQDKIFGFVYRMVGDGEEAKDLAQETFLRAFKALPRFRAGAPFSPWLYRIAINTTLNFLRGRRQMAHWEVDAEMASALPSPERIVEGRETASLLAAILLTLPEHYRAVLVLRHVNELSYQEMARALDLPVSTVKVRLFRAREMMQRRLQEKGWGRE